MNHFSSLLASTIPSESASAQQKSYVTYTLASLSPKDQVVPTITLLESRNLVAAAGTTGLRTWEAALHLGNYLCANENIVRSRSVLDLGAGTGYVSVLCAKLGALHVLSTDGSEDVVSSLDTNFYLNGLQDASFVKAKELKWGQAFLGTEHPDWNEGRKVDLVLGADVTYDGSGILPLLATFDDLFDLNPEVEIILAATVRNPATFESFLQTCARGKFSVEQIEFSIEPPDSQDGPFLTNDVPIQICNITRL